MKPLPDMPHVTHMMPQPWCRGAVVAQMCWLCHAWLWQVTIPPITPITPITPTTPNTKFCQMGNRSSSASNNSNDSSNCMGCSDAPGGTYQRQMVHHTYIVVNSNTVAQLTQQPTTTTTTMTSKTTLVRYSRRNRPVNSAWWIVQLDHLLAEDSQFVNSAVVKLVCEPRSATIHEIQIAQTHFNQTNLLLAVAAGMFVMRQLGMQAHTIWLDRCWNALVGMVDLVEQPRAALPPNIVDYSSVYGARLLDLHVLMAQHGIAIDKASHYATLTIDTNPNMVNFAAR